MSRIIVKNLPKGITEEQIKKHFEVKGVVTDVKILKTPNGQTRNFCFVGFKSEDSTKKAIGYFNNTYIKTSRITVEIAKLQNDPSLKRKNGRYVKDVKKPSNDIEERDNDELNKLLNTKESKIKRILQLIKETKTSAKFDQATDELKKKEQQENIEMKEQPINEKSEEEEEKNKEKRNIDKEKETLIKDNEKKLNPKRLYLRNIPFQITEQDLKDVFSKYGQINEVHIPMNHKTNESFGYGYIAYDTPDSSIMALSKMDGEYFLGRRLHISIAEEKASKPPKVSLFESQFKLSSYKAMKNEHQRSNYADETNWNYLFLNQNAVIESIAERLNISKSELFNKDNADIAVQIAAMETTLIKETKEWLLTQGINLELLKGKRPDCVRSNTIIFVKNISSKTNKEQLEKIFSRYGSLVRFLISPSYTLAICEYVNAHHAKNCLKHLSYFEVEGLPLYLEFAPEGLISKEKINTEGDLKENKDKDEKEIDLIKSQGKVLFVSNLNFSTNDNQLRKLFEGKKYKVKTAQVATHFKEGKQVSSGFGFVEFETEEDALKALKNLQGYLFNGHSLKLSISKTSTNEDSNKLSNKKRKMETELNDHEYKGEDVIETKLLIKNLAFEATKEELRKLFKNYGQVKGVRLPLKIDGSHRGFAFIEFMSNEEAQSAFSQLQNTHFYGRKLVIEWAKSEKTIEELRETTQRKANVINIETHKKQSKGVLILKH